VNETKDVGTMAGSMSFVTFENDRPIVPWFPSFDPMTAINRISLVAVVEMETSLLELASFSGTYFVRAPAFLKGVNLWLEEEQCPLAAVNPSSGPPGKGH